jgi:hypothetical protein
LAAARVRGDGKVGGLVLLDVAGKGPPSWLVVPLDTTFAAVSPNGKQVVHEGWVQGKYFLTLRDVPTGKRLLQLVPWLDSSPSVCAHRP